MALADIKKVAKQSITSWGNNVNIMPAIPFKLIGIDKQCARETNLHPLGKDNETDEWDADDTGT